MNDKNTLPGISPDDQRDLAYRQGYVEGLADARNTRNETGDALSAICGQLVDSEVQPVREESKELFKALTSGRYSNFALFSVLYDGEPTEAIVAVNQREDGIFEIDPVAVIPTDKMLDRLLDPDGRPPDGSEPD